ncbi:DNA repair protein RecO [Culicoidibacter larvae]|uniref:DNA repair protein RecO n=1 Tax=Culicoidibacter larvae TaxID=2579976 RepID=A0A5R8Q8J2_9FIRM|nr:DNA repair protein RecO [Culicoidibacter larvae]TLG72032.1 DNA repair protein RecO [Culicoidibacter larvae]
MQKQIDGIVIRRINYGESHEIITILTDTAGKLGLFARGSKKSRSKLYPATKLFVDASFTFNYKEGLSLLYDAEIYDYHRRLSEDIMMMAYASYFCELLDRVIPEKEAVGHSYQLLKQLLTLLENGINPKLLRIYLEREVLGLVGIRPKLDGCVRCGGTQDIVGLSLNEGGLLCRKCYRGELLIIQDPMSLRILRAFDRVNLTTLETLDIDESFITEIQALYSALFDQYSGLLIKSRSFLEQL